MTMTASLLSMLLFFSSLFPTSLNVTNLKILHAGIFLALSAAVTRWKVVSGSFIPKLKNRQEDGSGLGAGHVVNVAEL